MEPALTVAIACAGILAATLVVDLGGVCVNALGRVGLNSHRTGMARLGRFLAAVLVMSALLRIGHSGAATPPPAQRMELSEPAPREAVPQPADVAATVNPDVARHVVKAGECLWRIAKSHLEANGSSATGADVSRFWRAMYAQNRDVIGPDPNLILPGQVLVIPGGLDGT